MGGLWRRECSGMILIPQYRTSRRAAAAGDVDIVESKTYFTAATSQTISFTSTPTSGQVIVVLAANLNGTPYINSLPSGFGLRLDSNVNHTAQLYDYTCGGSESNSYTFSGTNNFTLHAFLLSGGSYLTGGTNNAAGVTSMALSSSALVVPSNGIAIGGLTLGGTGTPTNSDSFTTAGHGATTRGWSHYREFTSGNPSQNCTASWLNARSPDSVLGVYAP